MTKLSWAPQSNRYESGVDRGVFYPANGSGEAWNGLTSVQESPSDADDKPVYVDGVRVRNRRRRGEFSGVIESFSYPPSFYEDVMSQRRAKPFGMSYRTMHEDSYKIHIVYNVLLGAAGKVYDQEDPIPYSWDFTTLPVAIPGCAPASHLIIESKTAYSWTTKALEDVLYGTDELTPSLPDFNGIVQIFEENSILQIINHGDGTWTAVGPDDVVSFLNPTTFQIDWPSVTYLDADTYTVHSL